MNATLLRANLRANWVLLLVFTLVLMIYVPTAIAMFNPESAEEMEAMLSLMPEGMIRAMGFVDLGTDLTHYLGNYLYGFIMIGFPMIYCITLANRLIARHVDNGSMAYLLTTPNTRVRIAATQALYLAGSLFVMLVIAVAVVVVMSEAMYPGLLDIPRFLALNWVTYLSLLAAASVGFVSSCAASETRQSLAVGAGVPVLFLVLRMLSLLDEQTAWMKSLSVYSFISVDRVLGDGSYPLVVTLVLVPVCAALIVIGIVVFDRRSIAV